MHPSGCGAGAAACFAAEQVGPSGHAVGIDVNAAMIDIVKSRHRSMEPRFEWHQGSAYQLPPMDEAVDALPCAQTLLEADRER